MHRRAPPAWPGALLATLLLAERASIEGALRRARVREADLDDLVQEVVLRVLRAIEERVLLPPERIEAWGQVVRSYLSMTAWRMGRRHVARWSLEQLEPRLPEDSFDPRPWLEARSELRAMVFPEDVLPLLMALAQGSELAPLAREVGLSVGTAHDRVRRFRLSACSRRRRIVQRW